MIPCYPRASNIFGCGLSRTGGFQLRQDEINDIRARLDFSAMCKHEANSDCEDKDATHSIFELKKDTLQLKLVIKEHEAEHNRY